MSSFGKPASSVSIPGSSLLTQLARNLRYLRYLRGEARDCSEQRARECSIKVVATTYLPYFSIQHTNNAYTMDSYEDSEGLRRRPQDCNFYSTMTDYFDSIGG